MTIPVTTLFTPQPPGISTQNPSAAAPANSWLATLLANATALGLPTTTWQAGDPIRTIMAIQAVSNSKEDAAIATQAQGQFLDYAATGTVTLTDLDGTTATFPVSPDPSIPGQNPNGLVTWLDLLAASTFNVRRTQATAATNPLYLVNTLGSSLGTFQPGTYHVANQLTGAGYSNQIAFTLSASAVAGTNITGITYAAGVLTVTTSGAHGLSTGAVVYLTGFTGISVTSGLFGGGITSASGFATITNTGTHTFTISGVTASGSYVSGGFVYVPIQVPFAADQPGTYGNASVAAITQLVTSSPQCWGVNLVPFAGAPWQSNASLAANCRAKLATLSPNGPAGAYLFYAYAAYLILNGGTLPGSPPSVLTAVQAYLQAVGLPPIVNPLPANFTLDGGPITRAVCSSDPHSGTVTTTIANASGPVAGCIGLAILGATAASPIVLQTAAAHGCSNNDWAQVNGVAGLNGAQGQWQVTVIDSTHLSLNGSTGTGSYTAGSGQISGGDLYAVSAVQQSRATPNAVTSVTRSASAVVTNVAATIYVPRALVGPYTAAATAILTTYLQTFPLGGLNVDGASNVLPLGSVEGLLFAAGQSITGQFYTLSVTGVTLNGVAADLAIGTTGVVQLGTITLNVLPV